MFEFLKNKRAKVFHIGSEGKVGIERIDKKRKNEKIENIKEKLTWGSKQQEKKSRDTVKFKEISLFMWLLG